MEELVKKADKIVADEIVERQKKRLDDTPSTIEEESSEEK
jgi:hypothetical protein